MYDCRLQSRQRARRQFGGRGCRTDLSQRIMSSEVENYDDSFEEEEYGDDDFETGSLDTGSQIVEEKSVQEQPVTQKQTNAKKNIPSTSPISKSTKREKSPSSKNTNRNSTEVEMLKIANDALRNQLREFAKALDVSLKQNKKMKESGLPGASKSMKVKAEMMKNMQKKIDVYKRANGELKRQLREMRDADKVVALENLLGQRDIEIKRLNRDNKALLSIQRSQAREMSARETAKSEWPQKIVSLENDIRVYREKLRKIRERDMKYMEERHEQTEKMADLVKANRRLKVQMEDMRSQIVASDTSLPTQVPPPNVKLLEEKAKKLKTQVNLLEKVKLQEQLKAKREIKKRDEDLIKLTEENKLLRAELDLKEKQVRMQVLQVKKVKKQLQDIVVNDEPISLPRRVPSFVPSQAHIYVPAPPSKGSANSKRHAPASSVNPSPLVNSRSNLMAQSSSETDTHPGEAMAAAKTTDAVEDDETGFGAEFDSDPDAEMAAIKLQAGFRGYTERNKVEQMKQEKATENDAAVALQSQFRGYKARQTTAAQKEQRDRDDAFNAQQRYNAAKNGSDEANEDAKSNSTRNATAAEIPPSDNVDAQTREKPKGALIKPAGVKKKKKRYY